MGAIGGKAGQQQGRQVMVVRASGDTRDIFGSGMWRRYFRIFLALACLSALILLASFAVYTRRGQAFDQLGMDLVYRAGLSSSIAESLTDKPHTIAILLGGSATAVLVAMVRRRFALAMRVAVLILGANLTTQILKAWIFDRPFQGVGYELANSFPSGHVTVVLTLAFALTIVAPQSIRSAVGLITGTAAAFAGAVIVAAGWHRPADIAGALLVVMIWSLVLSPQEVPQMTVDRLNSVTLTLTLVMLVSLGAIGVVLWSRLAGLADQYTTVETASLLMSDTTMRALQIAGVCAWVALVLGGIQAVVALQSGRRRAAAPTPRAVGARATNARAANGSRSPRR